MLIDSLHPLTSSRLAVIDFNATVRAAALSLSRPGIGPRRSVEGVLSKSDLVRHLTSPTSSAPPVSAPDEQVHLPLLGRTDEVIE
ncbi:hypothetical protein AU467_02495 [Mesorhizobium loti]|uniref:CBS domain-containing protein n=1 Tax=Rhizobium loti TaxID=381 RepID=A0A101KUR5_RHILI|nr:hypothetical protein AU467_02495 [Mesorhizobium loti]